MNILFISNNTSLYGANRSMLDMIRNLNPLKYKAYIILPAEDGAIYEELKQLGIQYKSIRMFSTVYDKGELNDTYNIMLKILKIRDNIDAVKIIMNYIDVWNIDIIHTNTSVINLGAIAALLTKKKHIWHIRELEMQYNYRHDCKGIDVLLMRQSDRIICISKYVKNNLINQYKHYNVNVVYNPIEEDRYRIDRKCYFTNDIIRVFIAGIICENKKQYTAVKALKELRKRGHKNIKLIIVGGGISGEYGQKITHYIADNNLHDCIELHPFSFDLMEYRKNADIAVMCSVHEALGRVTIESMFSELALIGASSGATEELIKDGYNGLKYNPDSESDLASKIEYVINHKKEAILMIKNAKQFAIRYFSAKNQIKKIEKIYMDVMTVR